MALAHLSIGTATDRIDLLDVRGFHCGDWEPAAEDTDDTFSESSLSDYRRLTSYRRTTTIEAIPLTLKRQGQNAVTQSTQNLRKMIEMAKDYWAEDFSQPYPVYLQARASCETNMRYALVHDGRLPRDSNPYREPFLQRGRRSLMTGLVLGVERGAWTENPPGTGTAIELSAIATYDGRTLGNVDDTETRDPTTAEGEVYIGNKWNKANITDVWYWDASAAAWCGANLMDAALPFAFLPPTPLQVDDLVVFGIDTSLADSGPFASLVFDIGTALNPDLGITIQWRYGQGGADPIAWPALTVQDNTNADGLATGDPFDTTGVRSVHWIQPNNWTVQNPQVGANPALGITGYWVCAYVTAIAGGGAPTPPIQQNRDIYTITWPYTEVQAAEVGGDFPALLKLKLRNQSDNDGPLAASAGPNLSANRVFMAARSLDRGADFCAYINYSSEQNAPGVSITVDAGPALTADSSAITGWIWRTVAPAGGNTIRTTIAAAYAQQYFGRFRWLLRAKTTDHTAAHSVRGSYWTNTNARQVTDYIYFSQSNAIVILDLGLVTIPLTSQVAVTEEVTSVEFTVSVYGDGVETFDVIDMILVPVDEWAAVLDAGAGGGWLANRGLSSNTYLLTDSIELPRLSIRGLTRYFANDRLWYPYKVITNNSAQLKPQKEQRIWIVQDQNYVSALIDLGSFPFAALSAQAWRQQRYFSMRGDQ